MADPAALAIFNALLASVAEEMGVTLGRTAYSPNIKERRDYSCAVFDPKGQMVAQAAHIPVHLGAMPVAVEAVRGLAPFRPGDMYILNDPYLGGTHLPDISLVSPVFVGRAHVGFVTNRAHHADVGGMSPGSMPVATELHQEGVIIPPLRLFDRGRLQRDVLTLLLRNMRVPEQRQGDFDAQIAAQRTGEKRLAEIARSVGRERLRKQTDALLDWAERLTRNALRAIPAGTYSAEDVLDGDGQLDEPVPLRVALKVRSGALHCDFTGCSPQRKGSVNAVASVTRSAVYYVVRCLLEPDAPSNAGLFRPVSFTLPEGTIVNAHAPAAVSAGNVETSQRIVDVVLRALANARPELIPAASSGTMNNLTIGGQDPRTGRAFTYYETIGGGAGGGPRGPGLSAVQTHMTNTLNTPVEALELAFPFKITTYAIRDHSGGAGRHPGGDGTVRVYRFEAPATVSLISERRRFAPWGLAGGSPGFTGRNLLRRADGSEVELPAKSAFEVDRGDELHILTPGGGGWGRADSH
ncbi:MAG: hydantoinase B/oxoprolinase family protein [Myxococcaceae bacterium]